MIWLIIGFLFSIGNLLAVNCRHYINKSNIEKANFYEEDFDYDKACKLKITLDKEFTVHAYSTLFFIGLIVLYCFVLTFKEFLWVAF